jgi:GDP-L-fucose synthase
MLEKTDKIFVAGHTGLVGRAVVGRLLNEGFNNLVTRPRAELDLTDQSAVQEFFRSEKPDVVVFAAAKVGGIKANIDYPVEFLLDNLVIQNNVIRAAHDCGAQKLLFLASSCIYPRRTPQPMPESALLTGRLEPTNEAYAIAKIAGIKLCQAYAQEYGANFVSALPANIYGPNDNFDLNSSHVLAGILRRTHDAKMSGARELVLWGTGNPRREFLHVEDAASAILFLLRNYDSPKIINIGSGEDLTIRELAETICGVVGFKGEIKWDQSKPDGIPRKLLDVSKLNALGWRAAIPLREGIEQTYRWYLDNKGRS